MSLAVACAHTPVLYNNSLRFFLRDKFLQRVSSPVNISGSPLIEDDELAQAMFGGSPVLWRLLDVLRLDRTWAHTAAQSFTRNYLKLATRVVNVVHTVALCVESVGLFPALLTAANNFELIIGP